jgi:hypothetical protein
MIKSGLAIAALVWLPLLIVAGSIRSLIRLVTEHGSP